jgi:hypothetical protein
MIFLFFTKLIMGIASHRLTVMAFGVMAHKRASAHFGWRIGLVFLFGQQHKCYSPSFRRGPFMRHDSLAKLG